MACSKIHGSGAHTVCEVGTNIQTLKMNPEDHKAITQRILSRNKSLTFGKGILKREPVLTCCLRAWMNTRLSVAKRPQQPLHNERPNGCCACCPELVGSKNKPMIRPVKSYA